jgi:integrase
MTVQLMSEGDLTAEKERLCLATLAHNTLKSYNDGWRRFQQWCDYSNRSSLPAAAETVALWATSMLHEGLRISSVAAWVAAVAHFHREAGLSLEVGEVRRVMNGARRIRSETPQGKRAVTIQELWKMSRLMNAATLRGARNRAIIVVGFAGAFRRSELAGLDIADVFFVPKGLLIRLRHSKTDQEWRGREVGIFRGENADTCPVRTLQAWLRWRGNQPGPLFFRVTNGDTLRAERIGGEGVADVVKRAVASLGLDPHLYAGHSLRAGYVTAAAENGSSEIAIMQRTGHKTVEMVHRYFRPVTAFAVNPLAGRL